MTIGPFSLSIFIANDPELLQPTCNGKLFALVPGKNRYLRPDGTVQDGTNYTGTMDSHGSGYYDTLGEVIEAYGKYCAKQSASVAPATPSAPTIEPGGGYRLLAKDELVEKGDEYYLPRTNSWEPSEHWRCSPKTQNTELTYRRKLHATPSAPVAKRRRVIVDRPDAKDAALVDVYEIGGRKQWGYANGSIVYEGDLPKTWTIIAVVNEG